MTLLIQGHRRPRGSAGRRAHHRHPEVSERLRAEAQTEEREYLDAVVKESLRVRPPLPIGARLVNRPSCSAGTSSPGTLVAACIWLLHHHEDLYPEPHRFRPERFLERPASQWTWIPFGGGHRTCIGGCLAMNEIKAVLRTLLG